MDILPVSLYEYLVLFGLCLVSFLIGWFAGKKRKTSNIVKNEVPQTGVDIGIGAQKTTLRAVQTRRRGGEAVAGSTVVQTEIDNEESITFTSASPEEADDLTQINGIGDTIEKKLNQIGVYTFLQISNFSPGDIKKVARHLESFPKKIEKAKWVQQARELLEHSKSE